MDKEYVIKKLDETITSFRNASNAIFTDNHFNEFERLIQQLPDTEQKKITCYQQAGEALFAKMLYGKAKQYFEQGLFLARRQKKNSSQALILGALAELERVQGNYRIAFSFINDALDILAKNENTIASARLLILAGLNDISLGMYQSATKRFYQSYTLYKKLEDKAGIALALIRLGTAQMMLQNYAEAEKRLEQSLTLCNAINDKHLKAGALTNLGEIYRLENKCTQALASYAQANQLFEEMGLWRGVAITMNNMAHISVRNGERQKAKERYQEVFQTSATHGLFPEMMDTLAGLSLLLYTLDNKELAQKIAQKLINAPSLLDESRHLLRPFTDEMPQNPGNPAVISSDELKNLFNQAMQAI